MHECPAGMYLTRVTGLTFLLSHTHTHTQKTHVIHAINMQNYKTHYSKSVLLGLPIFVSVMHHTICQLSGAVCLGSINATRL